MATGTDIKMPAAIAAVLVVGLAAGTLAIVAGETTAASSRYTLKILVSDKNETARVFEGLITEQLAGSKTSIIGDKVNARVSSDADVRNKNNKKQSVKNWLGALQNGDYVTVRNVGYRSDGTLETFKGSKFSNRSR